MKRLFLCFLLFLLIYLILPLGATAQVVEIPDPNLRVVIETELGKAAAAPITVKDMSTLTELDGRNAGISDLTGLESATNLTVLYLWVNSISDISPLSGLTNLKKLGLNSNLISDISPLTGLTQVTWLRLQNNSISDISALAGLIQLQDLVIYLNSISDLSPLAGLIHMRYLDLGTNLISDLSPLARLTKLEHLHVVGRPISDLSPLSGLTNLTRLGLWRNNISDLSPLAGLTKLVWLDLNDNFISDISPLTELITLETLDLEHNSISDLSPLVANIGLGTGDTIIVVGNPLSDTSINTHIPTLRSRGVTVHNTSLSIPAVKRTNVGDTFTLDLIVEDVVNLAGWQIDVAFNPRVLEAVSVTEGDFLSKDGANTLFLQGTINNAAGTITGIHHVLLGDGGVSGAGKLLSITLEGKATGRERVQLHNLALGSANGDDIPYGPVPNPIITVGASRDINGDGSVNISDLILVSQNLGSSNSQADINDDGRVDIFDLIAVAQYLGESVTGLAPGVKAGILSKLNPETVQHWIDMAHAANDGSLTFQTGIINLERLLEAMRPDQTVLLANYPNPFNPETWIPYQLAHDADVTLTIYDTKGALVRQLDLGHQETGYYTDKTRAAYWDGRNNLGESVGSGIYFYQLRAGDYSTTRKMVILK